MFKASAIVLLVGAALATVGSLTLTGSASTKSETSVGLGAAGSYVVLAGAGVTNTGPTTLNGDIGTFPTTSESGTGSLTINGANHAGDAVTQQAKNDLVTAYNSAAGEGPTSPIAADLAGLTLTPGVYNSASALGLSGTLTLNGQGNPDAVFVFQAASSLTTASGSSVSLTNGAQACHVFWQIGSSATIGTGSAFRGTVLALTSITLTTGATVEGRVLARNGAVTLDTNTITAPSCTTSSAPPTTSAAATTTATTTTTTSTVTATVAKTPAQVAAAKQAAAKKAAAKKAAAKKAAAKKAATTVVIKAPPLAKAPHTLRPKPPVTKFGITG